MKQFTLLLCFLAGSRQPTADSLYAAEPFTAEGITVKDGDTLHVQKLHLGWGVALVDQTLRCADFDAWESSRRRQTVDVTDAEIIKGKRAAAVLAEIVRTRRLRIEPHIGRDRDVYGRLLVVIFIVDGDPPLRPLADFMEAGGHCRSPPTKQ
jgi:endonuclease YncB( thermonuclease family)